jgi:hypothetical protein
MAESAGVTWERVDAEDGELRACPSVDRPATPRLLDKRVTSDMRTVSHMRTLGSKRQLSDKGRLGDKRTVSDRPAPTDIRVLTSKPVVSTGG